MAITENDWNDGRAWTDERDGMTRWLAYAGIAGMVALSVTMLIADVVVPNHDWMSDTISDLAAGRHELLLDTGMYLLAFGTVALAVAAGHVHLGGKGWSMGVWLLMALALLIFWIGARDEYGDGDSEGVTFHLWLVGGLYAAMAVAPWAMSAGAGRVEPWLRTALRATTVAWVPLAPLFFVVPDAWDGAYERFLGLILFAFLGLLATAFLIRVRRGHGTA
ncbi:DUF998 domain-containing protein [Jannaschia sp. Os4]|uniref:DUF998 domain-containing protein n=1 Tax=Jannaschia sp. Os4 TaxID=2807617 RepID=UPI00193A60BA|nr:DUF998 domain-containing protein [Jannaschia sp. Os4]MBM2577306.1 DUF998 domain-containing protein [Jannaschia sp. Os4]